jgi:hypothetical protein
MGEGAHGRNFMRSLLFSAAACAVGVLAIDAGNASAQPQVNTAPSAPTPEEAQKQHEHKTADLAAIRTPIARAVRVESPAEEARMQAYIASRYSPQDVKHTFKHVGEDFDCVDVNQQPAMRRPEMAGRKIETPPPPHAAPPSPPAHGAAARSVARPTSTFSPFFTAADKDENGHPKVCPAGSVPVRRVTMSELKAFKNLDDYHRKYPSHIGAPTFSQWGAHPQQPQAEARPKPLFGPNDSHQYAHANQTGLVNYGMHSTLNLWDPRVGSSGEFSLSQIWVVAGGPPDGLPSTTLQTLEVGAQVFPDLYGDNLPHLFIYSTQDGYNSHGCYNLSCGQFVQVNGAIAIGGALGTGSVSGGAQYEMPVEWVKYGSAWWLNVNNTWVGYYPDWLYSAQGLMNRATVIDAGGEIVDDRSKHSWHTTTGMGSGAYPSAGWTRASYQRQIWYFAAPNAGAPTWASGLYASRNSAWCYDISNVTVADPSWGTYFYFGGPGYNAWCQ